MLDRTTRCRKQLVLDNPGPRELLNALDSLPEDYGPGKVT